MRSLRRHMIAVVAVPVAVLLSILVTVPTIGSARAERVPAAVVPAAAPVPADGEPPSQPTGLWECVADAFNTVPFCWTASTDNVAVVAYDVYMRQANGFTLIGTTPRTYYFASGLVAGQYYTFYVVARDAAGNLSAPSAQYTARAQAGLPMPTVSPTPSPRPGCGITYRTSGWHNGFTATVGVTNTGGVTINGWTLRLTFPGNQKVVTAWPATWGQSGPSAWFANPGWNAEFSPGETVTLGFTATYTGADTRPTGFTVNGVSCAVEYL